MKRFARDPHPSPVMVIGRTVLVFTNGNYEYFYTRKRQWT